MKIHLDFETRSVVKLKACGAGRYALDPSTDVLLACWCVEAGGVRGPVRTWRRGDAPPVELIEAVKSGATVCAHNALFELLVWTYVCDKRLGWGPLPPEQMDCTMSRALIMSLPAALDDVAELLHVENRKAADGRALVRFFSSPRKPCAGEDPCAAYWNAPEAFPEKFAAFAAYCAQDVAVECDLDTALPQMSARERDVYHFDLRVNLRGFRLDTKLMHKALAFVNEAARRGDKELNALTGGAVQKATQLARLKAWLRGRGIEVETLGKGDVGEVLERAHVLGDTDAQRAIELRREGAKATSLAKFKSGLACAGPDEMARGLLVYHKASTGRWAARLYQPHNLERIDADLDGPVIEDMLRILRSGCSASDAVDWCEMLGYKPMRAAGKVTRAMIVAPEGHELIGCDYSNAEGRGSAWLAGEEWKLDAFRAYDAGTGPDLYKVSYASTYGEPVEAIGKGFKRQLGKVQELLLGFQGSVPALLKGTAAQGVNLEQIRDTVMQVAQPELWASSVAKYDPAKSAGLPVDVWTALHYVVHSWRRAHPKIVQGWWAVQDAVVAAVAAPGTMVEVLGGKVRVYCAANRGFLHIYLPSGRPLSYFRPVLRAQKDALGRVRYQVVVEGWDSRKNYWGHVGLYGGLIWENIVQALCRDLLVDGLLACERAGYPVCLHVHDEGVFSVPVGKGSTEEVQHLMAQKAPWAAGFPLTSAAWRDVRFVK